MLGILTVHCNNGFGFVDANPTSHSTDVFHAIIGIFLNNKCNIAFTTLFGASFGLILRNKNNTSFRFFWRCLLLMGFGIINKFFYWYDALMLFGFTGIMIIPFRYLRARTILLVTIALYFITPLVWPFVHAGTTIFHNWIPGPTPEISVTSFSDILHRPLWEGILTYTYVVTIQGGILRRFMFMALGYLFVRCNIIYHVTDYLKGKYLAAAWCLTIVAIFIQNYVTLPALLTQYKALANPIACYTYCYTILFIYYRWKTIAKYMLKLAPYGRMSLTNYTMQSLISVWIFTTVGRTTQTASPLIFIAYVLGLFGAQLLFSYYWMKYMSFGPMEWLWRMLTKMQYIPLRREKHAA